MATTEHKPELIIIAGPNGSGKTSVTQKFLHHEWAEGTVYINPDQVSCIRMGDSWDSTFIYLPGLRDPFEVKGDMDSIMEKLGLEFG